MTPPPSTTFSVPSGTLTYMTQVATPDLPKIIGEVWHPLPYPRNRPTGTYWISTEGRLWSTISSAVLAASHPDPDAGFYAKFHTIPVHYLVLTTFTGPRPPRHLVRHLNGDSWDNRLANLKWGTQKENALDRAWHAYCRTHDLPKERYVRLDNQG